MEYRSAMASVVVSCLLLSMFLMRATCQREHCRLQASDFGDVIINNNEPAPDADGIVHIPHGTKVHFTCARGHDLINQNRNTPRCWMGHLQDITHIPYCSPVRCDYPPYPEHGSYNLEQGDSTVHGSAIRYECYKGYQLQDPSKEYSYCVDGRWSPEELPVCQRLTVPVTETPNANAPCPTPSPPNALVFHNGQNIALIDSVINFGQGDWIVTRCINHYSANGRKAVDSMCSNGAWTPALPSCEAAFQKRSCSRPATIPHVRQYVDGLVKLPDSLRTVFHHNSYMISHCVDPLKKKLMTGALRMCNDGQWDGPVPRCESAAISFAIPSLYTMLHQFLANGTLLIYPRVGELTIQCIVSGGKSSLRASHSEGFTPIENGKWFGRPIESHSGIYTCLKAGSEDYHLLSIQVRAVSCGEPLPPLNGRRIGNDFRLSQTVSFECNEGYDLQGEQQIKCNAGEWIGDVPYCRARACPEIRMEELDPNLRLKVDGGTSQGSVLAFSCILGFHNVGETFLTCQGGRWSHPFPTCNANDEDELDTGTLPTPDTCNCEVWQRCVPNSYGQWTCNCINPQQCDDTTSQQQYCGSDGYTYTSICRLKATACLLDLDIQVASQGPCPERDPVLDESSSESSQSSISDPESTTLIFATLTEGQGNDSVPPRNETRQASSGNYLACGYNTDRYNTNTTRQTWGRISGGDSAEEGKWPWQVALFCRNCKRCLPTFFCGGSLIASNWVLSAAHCFKDCPASNIRVYTGFIDKSTSSLQLFDPALVYTLDGDDALIKHEAFNSSVNLDNDIALLRLSCSVKLNSKITPICMPQFVAKARTLYSPKGEPTFVAGWGTTRPYDYGNLCIEGYRTTPSRLRHVVVPVRTHEECRQSFLHHFQCATVSDYKPDIAFCAGEPEGGSDACKGDSGGPVMRQLTVADGTRRWVQIGIVSWGEGCAVEGRYGIYTRLSAYTDWIQEQVGDQLGN